MLKYLTLILIFTHAHLFAQIQVRGGELFSKEQALYGRYEIRMKTAQGSGILSTFFTFENNGWMPDTDNPWREIDIEVLGRYNDRFQSNIITGTAENRVTSEYYPPLSVNPHSNYHTYSIEWTPDYIAFSFDGEEMRRTNFGDAKNQIEDCRDIPQSYRFNMWANAISGWVGNFSPDILPAYQFVNWIKYYSYSPQSGEFTLDWEDNFESLDIGRWTKATHSIENFTQFNRDNIIVSNGKLILALTDMDGNGLSGITVPEDSDDGVSVSSSKKTGALRIRNSHSIEFSGKTINVIQTLGKESSAAGNIFDLRGRLQPTFTDDKVKGRRVHSF